MHELLTAHDIERIYKPTHFLEVPATFIKEIAIYYDDEVKRYNQQQARNEFMSPDGLIRLSTIYEDDRISQTKITLNFELIAREVNNALVRLYSESAQKLGDSY